MLFTKKFISYFVIWNLILQHTYCLCAYGMGGIVVEGEPPQLLRQVRGVSIPFSKGAYMREAIEVAGKVFREGGSFETPEMLSFYLPPDLKSPDLLEQAEAKKKRVDLLWVSPYLKKESFKSKEELAFYVPDLTKALTKTSQDIIVDALVAKQEETLDAKDDSITEVKAQILPGKFEDLKKHEEIVKSEQELFRKLVKDTKDQEAGFKNRREALYFTIRMGLSIKAEGGRDAIMVLRRQAYAIFKEQNQDFKDFEDFCTYWSKPKDEETPEQSYRNAVLRKILVHMIWEMGGRDQFEHPDEISYYLGDREGFFKEVGDLSDVNVRAFEGNPDLLAYRPHGDMQKAVEFAEQKRDFIRRFLKNKDMAALTEKVFGDSFVQRIPDGFFKAMEEKSIKLYLLLKDIHDVFSWIVPEKDLQKLEGLFNKEAPWLLSMAAHKRKGHKIIKKEGGFRLDLLRQNSAGQVLSRTVREYRGGKETFAINGTDTSAFDLKDGKVSLKVGGSVVQINAKDQKIRLERVSSAPLRISSPWALEVGGNQSVSTLFLKAPSITHLGNLSGKTYEAIVTKGLWTSPLETLGFGSFTVWGGDMLHRGTMESFGPIFLSGKTFKNTGTITGEDIGLGNSLTILVDRYQNLGTIEVDDLDVSVLGKCLMGKMFVNDAHYNRGKEIVHNHYNLTLDDQFKSNGTIRAGSFDLKAGNGFSNRGLIEVDGRMNLRGKGFYWNHSYKDAAIRVGSFDGDVYQFSNFGVFESLGDLSLKTRWDLFVKNPIHSKGKVKLHAGFSLVQKAPIVAAKGFEIKAFEYNLREKGSVVSDGPIKIEGALLDLFGKFMTMTAEEPDILRIAVGHRLQCNQNLRCKNRLSLIMEEDAFIWGAISTPGAIDIRIRDKKDFAFVKDMESGKGITVQGARLVDIGFRQNPGEDVDTDEKYDGTHVPTIKAPRLLVRGGNVNFRYGNLEQVESMEVQGGESFHVLNDLTVGKLNVKTGRVIAHKKQDGTLPLVATTRATKSLWKRVESPLAEGEPSLSLEAEELYLKEARIAAKGPVVLKQKKAKPFVLPDTLETTGGLTIENEGPIAVEKPIKSYGRINLVSKDSIRIGKEGELVDLQSLYGSLYLDGKTLDLQWARVFGEMSLTLTSKEDILVGKAKEEWRSFHFDHNNHPHIYHLSNGAFLASNYSVRLRYKRNFLNDVAEIIAGSLDVRGIDSLIPAESFHNQAGVIWIRGNADFQVNHFKNTPYSIWRRYFQPTDVYVEGYIDIEPSGHAHMRIDGKLTARSGVKAENINSILNPVGGAYINGKKEDFVYTDTVFRKSASRHKNDGHFGDETKHNPSTQAQFVTGKSLDITTGTVDNTGTIVVGRDARFRTLKAFKSTSYDFNLSGGRIVDVSLSDYLQHSSLFKVDVEAPDYVIQPTIPLRSDLTILPQNILVPKGVTLGDVPVRLMMHPLALEYALATMQGNDKERMKTPQQRLDYLQGNTTRFVQSAMKAITSGDSILFLEDGRKVDVSTQLIQMDNPDTLVLQLAPLVKEPMLFWQVQMVNGIPTLEPRCIRPEHVQRTGYISVEDDLSVDSDGTVHINGGEVGARSIGLHSRELMDLQGRTETYTRENSNNHHVKHTVVIPTALTSREGDVELTTEGDLRTGSTKVHSAGNTDVRVAGSHHDRALSDIVETHTVHRSGGEKVEHTHTVSTPVVSEFVAENGHIDERVQGVITLQAAHFSSQETTLRSGTGIAIIEAHRVVTDTTQVTERGGPLRKDHRSSETSQVATSVGGLFEGPARLIAPRADLTNVTAAGLLEIDADDTTFRPGTTIRKHTRQEHRSDLVWTEGYSSGSESLTYDPISLTNMRVNRGNVVVEYGAQQDLGLLRSQVGNHAQFVRLYDQRSSYYDEYSAPGALTNVGVALLVDSFLPGFGSGMWAAMGHAATSAALSQVVLTQRINPTDLLIAASTAGALHKLTSSIPYLEKACNAKVRTFGQQTAYHMTRATVPSVVSAAFGRDVFWEDVMRMGAVSTVAAWGAGGIGASNLTGIEKKLAHGFTQSLAGYVLDRDNHERGILTGFASGFMAPTILEWIGGTPEERFARIRAANPTADPETLYALSMDSMRQDMKITQFLTTAGVGVFGGNPMLASTTSHSVMENNCLKSLLRMALKRPQVIIKVLPKGAKEALKKGVETAVKAVRSSGEKAVKVGKTGKPNGNSLSYEGETHVYAIRGQNGTTHKVGESMQGLTRMGQSKRAEMQARRLFKDTGQKFQTEIRRTFSTKAEARAYEERFIRKLEGLFGKKPVGNKTYH